MNQFTDQERLQTRLEQLTRARAQLVPALQSCARELSTSGRLSLEPLELEVANYRRGLRECWNVEGCSGSEVPERLCLHDLEHLLAQRDRAERAFKVLEQILQLHHDDDPGFLPLQQCAAQARELTERLRTERGDWVDVVQSELAEGSHPLAALLRLVDRGDLLDDDDWRACFEIVTGSYGRAMGTAVARGRIHHVIPPSPPKPAPIVVTAAPAIAAEPQRRLPEVAPAAPVILEKRRAADTTAPTSSGTPDQHEDELIFELTPPASRIKPEQTASATDTDHALRLGGVPGRADQIGPRSVLDVVPTRGSAPRAPSIVDDALLKLLAAERHALAAHLAEAHDLRTQRPTAVVPGRLLRTIALGRELCYPKGEIALRLEQEFSQLKANRLPARSEDHALAYSLWLRAACLMPALLGAAPSAIAILRSFTIQPGQSHLYNFCSRVAAFGDRLQGWATELFQPPTDQTRWQQEEEQLRDEVRLWLTNIASRSVTYGRASPLFLHAHWTVLAGPAITAPEAVDEWARWQEVLLQAHRLLRPIRDGLVSERNAIKQDLSRLEALLKSEAGETTLEGRSYGALTPEMRGRLREALEFANRWLRLQASAPRKAPPLAPQAIDELRQDLLERAAGVIDELHALGHAANSALVGSATMCCRRAVECVRELCSGKQSLALHEADPRVVLNAVLLKIPELELNPQMEPEATIEDLERLLLEQAWRDDPSWREAFEQRSRQRDHQSTARIIELDVWKSVEERDALAQVRATRLAECRQMFALEIEEFRARVGEEFADREDLGPELAELLRRIERLRVSAPNLTTFHQAELQLERLRNAATRLSGADWRRSAIHPPGQVALPGDSRLLGLPQQQPTSPEGTTLTPKPQWIFSEE